jgi:hypothetical protein
VKPWRVRGDDAPGRPLDTGELRHLTQGDIRGADILRRRADPASTRCAVSKFDEPRSAHGNA